MIKKSSGIPWEPELFLSPIFDARVYQDLLNNQFFKVNVGIIFYSDIINATGLI